MEKYNLIKESIPPSGSDSHLNEWGYDLLKELYQLVGEAGFDNAYNVFDFATGTGRMTALLTRLNFNVITGDLSFEQKPEAERRITPQYLNQVKFLSLNLESIPIQNGEIKNIVCVNTLHHLDNPVKCIEELIRVNSPGGKFLLADFNNEGFDLMDKVHQIKYGQNHTRGNFSWDEIKEVLSSVYKSVKEVNTRLNKGFIASNKN